MTHTHTCMHTYTHTHTRTHTYTHMHTHAHTHCCPCVCLSMVLWLVSDSQRKPSVRTHIQILQALQPFSTIDFKSQYLSVFIYLTVVFLSPSLSQFLSPLCTIKQVPRLCTLCKVKQSTHFVSVWIWLKTVQVFKLISRLHVELCSTFPSLSTPLSVPVTALRRLLR